MTKFPAHTRCSHGGFGQNRLDKCDATKSKRDKHRNFHDSCEFIKVVRGMLNAMCCHSARATPRTIGLPR